MRWSSAKGRQINCFENQLLRGRLAGPQFVDSDSRFFLYRPQSTHTHKSPQPRRPRSDFKVHRRYRWPMERKHARNTRDKVAVFGGLDKEQTQDADIKVGGPTKNLSLPTDYIYSLTHPPFDLFPQPFQLYNYTPEFFRYDTVKMSAF